MSGSSRIEWTEATWNPVTGCTKVSPGCANCYAETFAERWRGTPGHPYEQGFDLKLWPQRLDLPRTWRKPRLVFVNSMSDLFHEDVPDEYIGQVFNTMVLTQRHTYQVLTKRPERMRDLVRRYYAEGLGGNGRPSLRSSGLGVLSTDGIYASPNIWLGVSIENRRFVGRADALRDTPAAVRFISAEPLLGPLVYDTDIGMYNDCACGGDCAHPKRKGDPYTACWSDSYEGPELDLEGIDWLIAGAESGHGARPMNEEWVRGLRDAAEHEGTAFFYKQNAIHGRKLPLPELDGRRWTEMPAVSRERVA